MTKEGMKMEKKCDICGSRKGCACAQALTSVQVVKVTPAMIEEARRQREYEQEENRAERQAEYYAERRYWRQQGIKI